MMTFLACLGIALAPADDGPAGVEAARSYFTRLYDDRAAIKSGILVYKYEIERDDQEPTVNGSATTYRMWFDGKRQRLDVEEVRPNDPDEAFHSRYAYSDGIHRLIDHDSPDTCVREYTREYLKDQPAPLGPVEGGHWVDIRLFGVIGIDFGLVHHSQLDELKAFAALKTLRTTAVPQSGKDAVEYQILKPSGARLIYTTSGRSLLPVRMVAHFAPKTPEGQPTEVIRVEVDSEVETFTNRMGMKFDFPRTLRFLRIVEDQVTDIHKVAVISAEFNVPIEPELMTWKALGPRKGVALEYNDKLKIDRYAKIAWDGEKFRKMVNDPHQQPTDGESPIPPSNESGRVRMWSYASAALAAVLGTFVAWNKFRPRSAPPRSD